MTALRDVQEECPHAPNSSEVLYCQICKQHNRGSSVERKAQRRNTSKQQNDLRTEEISERRNHGSETTERTV